LLDSEYKNLLNKTSLFQKEIRSIVKNKAKKMCIRELKMELNEG